MTVVVSILNACAALAIALSLTYFLTMIVAGLRTLRRERVALSVQGSAVYREPYGDRGGCAHPVYFVIPCLNEERVIGATVAALSRGAGETVIVIDDGSDDDTSGEARAAGGAGLEVLRRELPDARKGKGAALNHGIARVNELVDERGDDPSEVLVCIMDADGRLSENALVHVEPLFEDPRVGGVQLAVRIRNRATNFLTRFQDFQFWAMSALSQFGRSMTKTVSLGGNGQFTRLSALRELGDQPWSDSLTEDLDLAVSLMVRGWHLDTTPNASVDQQAIHELHRLFVQRRRWYQGHMTAGARLRSVWNSPHLSHVRALEVSGYLAVPWLFDLPWSILSHWTLFAFISNAPSAFSFVTGPVSLGLGILAWYLLTFSPALMTSFIYVRRDPAVRMWRGLLMGHSFLVMNYLSYVCAWTALYRLVRGRRGWDKTSRVVERPVLTRSAGRRALGGYLRRSS